MQDIQIFFFSKEEEIVLPLKWLYKSEFSIFKKSLSCDLYKGSAGSHKEQKESGVLRWYFIGQWLCRSLKMHEVSTELKWAIGEKSDPGVLVETIQQCLTP